MKFSKRLVCSIIVGGMCLLGAFGMSDETQAKCGPYRGVKVVALMFTVDCINCGARAEADYSIVSEKGQVWCRECNHYEDLDKESPIVKIYFGEERYER